MYGIDWILLLFGHQSDGRVTESFLSWRLDEHCRLLEGVRRAAVFAHHQYGIVLSVVCRFSFSVHLLFKIVFFSAFVHRQLFEVFETTQNVSPERMNGIVKTAVSICTGVYILVGFFGYIAFCTQPFSGNILMSFSPSFTNDVIKIGFVLSIAFSFPLVIFPCRVSVNSLLYRRVSCVGSGFITWSCKFQFAFI